MQNLITTRRLAILFASFFAALLSGCGEDVVVKRMKPAPPEAVELAPVEDLTEALAEFAAPYPEQVVLFEPDMKKPAKATDRSNAAVDRPAAGSQSEPNVELMGFGSVGVKHALLLIDGQMEALRVGEQHGTVEVLNIEPPRVKLRVAGRVHEKSLQPKQDS